MARVTGVGKGAPVPPEGPKFSSTLAHNVGSVTKAVSDAWLINEPTNLEGRMSTEFIDKTSAREVAAKNMLKWHPYL